MWDGFQGSLRNLSQDCRGPILWMALSFFSLSGTSLCAYAVMLVQGISVKLITHFAGLVLKGNSFLSQLRSTETLSPAKSPISFSVGRCSTTGHPEPLLEKSCTLMVLQLLMWWGMVCNHTVRLTNHQTLAIGVLVVSRTWDQVNTFQPERYRTWEATTSLNTKQWYEYFSVCWMTDEL